MSNSAPISTAEAMRIEGDLRVVDVEVRAALSTGQYQDLAAAFAHGLQVYTGTQQQNPNVIRVLERSLFDHVLEDLVQFVVHNQADTLPSMRRTATAYDARQVARPVHQYAAVATPAAAATPSRAAAIDFAGVSTETVDFGLRAVESERQVPDVERSTPLDRDNEVLKVVKGKGKAKERAAMEKRKGKGKEVRESPAAAEVQHNPRGKQTGRQTQARAGPSGAAAAEVQPKTRELRKGPKGVGRAAAAMASLSLEPSEPRHRMIEPPARLTPRLADLDAASSSDGMEEDQDDRTQNKRIVESDGDDGGPKRYRNPCYYCLVAKQPCMVQAHKTACDRCTQKKYGCSNAEHGVKRKSAAMVMDPDEEEIRVVKKKRVEGRTPGATKKKAKKAAPAEAKMPASAERKKPKVGAMKTGVPAHVLQRQAEKRQKQEAKAGPSHSPPPYAERELMEELEERVLHLERSRPSGDDMKSLYERIRKLEEKAKDSAELIRGLREQVKEQQTTIRVNERFMESVHSFTKSLSRRIDRAANDTQQRNEEDAIERDADSRLRAERSGGLNEPEIIEIDDDGEMVLHGTMVNGEEACGNARVVEAGPPLESHAPTGFSGTAAAEAPPTVEHVDVNMHEPEDIPCNTQHDSETGHEALPHDSADVTGDLGAAISGPELSAAAETPVARPLPVVQVIPPTPVSSLEHTVATSLFPPDEGCVPASGEVPMPRRSPRTRSPTPVPADLKTKRRK